MAVLRLLPPSGPAIEITQDRTLIGRDPASDVVLADGSVSRKHAVIEKRGDEFVVADQGSANGTFIGNQRVAEASLKAGLELRFGGMPFRVEIEGLPAPEADATVIGSVPAATLMQSAEEAVSLELGEPLAEVLEPEPLPAQPSPPPPPPQPTYAGASPQRPAAPPPPPPRTTAAPPRTTATIAGPARAGGPVPQLPAESAEPLEPKSRFKGPWLWVGAGCCGCLLIAVILALSFGGLVYFSTKAPADAIQTQLGQIREGDVRGAYAAMSGAYRETHDLADFERFLGRHETLGKNRDGTFTNRNVSGGSARIEGFLLSSSGERAAVRYELVSEGGAWRIARIAFPGSPDE